MLFAAMVVAGIGAIIWRTCRRTPALGRIVLAGSVVHGAAAAVLFGISWFNLPILTPFHTGDGFWHLAPDARYYYRSASVAATQGLGALTDSLVSPVFFRILAIWMWLAGVHQAAPLLLNLAVYVATCVLIVHVARADAPHVPGASHTPELAVAVPLVALSGAPLLFLSGTQILKDMIFACAIAITLLGIRSLLRRMGEDASRPASLREITPKLVWLGLGVYVLAGIRPYYGMFIGAALALTLAAAVVLRPRWRTVRVAAFSAATLFVVWLGIFHGAAQYYPYYRDAAKSTLDAVTGRVFTPLLAVTTPVRAPNWNTEAPVVTANAFTMREGFFVLRGDTTIGQSSEGRDSSGWARAREIAGATLVGVATMFVPVSLLKAAHIVEIAGGRGLLFVADFDTLFMDATAIAVAWLLMRERRALGRDRAYLCVCLVLFALVTLMLAYVVTNLGMLVRLRLIAFVPLWMATLAISRARPAASAMPPVITALTGGPEARSA